MATKRIQPQGKRSALNRGAPQASPASAKSGNGWTRGDVLALCSVVVGGVSALAAIYVVPEFRCTILRDCPTTPSNVSVQPSASSPEKPRSLADLFTDALPAKALWIGMPHEDGLIFTRSDADRQNGHSTQFRIINHTGQSVTDIVLWTEDAKHKYPLLFTMSKDDSRTTGFNPDPGAQGSCNLVAVFQVGTVNGPQFVYSNVNLC